MNFQTIDQQIGDLWIDATEKTILEGRGEDTILERVWLRQMK